MRNVPSPTSSSTMSSSAKENGTPYLILEMQSWYLWSLLQSECGSLRFCFGYLPVLGFFPELSNTISNSSPSDSKSKSICFRLFTLWPLLLAAVALLFSHWESILPMEKSSLLSSYPIAAGELLARGPMKHGFGVLCRFAGAYLNALCPRFTTTVMSAFAAKVGYSGFPNSSDLQWISWISCESTVKNTFFWVGLYPHPITFSAVPHSSLSDSFTNIIPNHIKKTPRVWDLRVKCGQVIDNIFANDVWLWEMKSRMMFVLFLTIKTDRTVGVESNGTRIAPRKLQWKRATST
nr:Os02g0614732 [Ipomoea batatas]